MELKGYARGIEEGDIEFLAENLRDDDKAELFAANGNLSDLNHILHRAVDTSTDVQIWIDPATDKPVGIFGTAILSLMGKVASPWFLATKDSRTFNREILMIGKIYTETMLEHFNLLQNYVDARNKKSISWLKRIGYKIYPAEKYGVEQLLFHRFEAEGVHSQAK